VAFATIASMDVAAAAVLLLLLLLLFLFIIFMARRQYQYIDFFCVECGSVFRSHTGQSGKNRQSKIL